MDKKCWIGKSENTIVLFYDELGYNISPNFQYPKEYIGGWGQHNFKDITKEYLSDTKIKVESEEHSKFIQELAFSIGMYWYTCHEGNLENMEAQYLYFDDRGISWSSDDDSGNDTFFKDCTEKQIFLPLPPDYAREENPKEENHSTEVEIYWNEPLKNDYEEMFVDYKCDSYVRVKNKESDLRYSVDPKTGYPIGKEVPEELSIINDISNYRKVELIAGKDIAAKLKEEGLINDYN